MKRDGDIVSFAAEELRAMIERGEGRTDWARLDATSEEKLEAAIASDPDWADIPRDWYQHARPHYPADMKRHIRLPVDGERPERIQPQGPRL